MRRVDAGIVQEIAMGDVDAGIVNVRSGRSLDETVERIRGLLAAKGVTIFAVVDHSGEAAKVGMTMRPTKLVIFGNPKAGTPVMLAAPSAALDLPLKLLVWEDASGVVWISYNSAEYLARRHGVPGKFLQVLGAAKGLAESAAG